MLEPRARLGCRHAGDQALKQQLADAHHGDRERYTAGKTDFIAAALRQVGTFG